MKILLNRMPWGRILLGSAALIALGACGLKGDLATPGPLWDGDNRQAAVERGLPNAEDRTQDRIIFTRDDVDLFGDDVEEEDPFAEDDDADDSSDGAP